MPPCIFIVIAIYAPKTSPLKQQLASLAAQDYPNVRLIAVIADTTSGPLVEATAQEVGIPVEIVTPATALDAVRAFEYGLAESLARAEEKPEEEALFALCDQDDFWHPDRLSRGVAALRESGADLVHSDARLVAEDGTQLHPSMFAFEHRLRTPGQLGLLYRNNITGMTTLMRQRVIEIALPFPQQSGVHYYHDLWLGLVASALGGIALIDAPLVDYRQHGGNTIGAIDRLGGPLGALRRPWHFDPMMWLRREAAAYALASYLAHSLQNRLVECVASGQLADGSVKASGLRPFLSRRRGALRFLFDAIGLALRGQGELANISSGFAVVKTGRLVWALREALGPGLRDAINAFDARLYSMSPGVSPRQPQIAALASEKAEKLATVIDPRKHPRWKPVFSARTPALTILVPTLNPTEIFAGVLTAIDIGVALAEAGYDIRFIATDLPIASAAASRSFVLRRLKAGGAQRVGEKISLHCGVQSAEIPAHRDDLFFATAWWTAHVIRELTAEHDYARARFLYLIQDFEPNFYAWGPEYADAMASYALDFQPIFNTTLLRDYFAEQGFGFAAPQSLTFRPAIDVGRYNGGARAERGSAPRRLALYGRPEVPRNMYSTAVEALAGFIEAQKLTPDDIELVSVGLRHAPLKMPGGLTLRSLGKLPWEEYPGFLLGVDLGLSLMYSPHPSHPPIEMAASGVRVVTNGFGPKDLSRLSPAILSVAPTVPALVEALGAAWAAPPVSQAEREIDLSPLGLPMDEMIAALSTTLSEFLPRQDIASDDP